MTPNKPLLTADEVADIVGVSGETVRRWARDGLVPFIKLPGGHFRFRREDVDSMIGAATTTEAVA